jgi:translation initiation factor IF-2
MASQKKPPVVTIMGHVDHGKTTLLDYIRKTKLVEKEVGQITQAIGAYQIKFKGEKITFIDTPGHEAFTKMRSRGANVADVIVLVVAANDGVMPQTKESVKIIEEAKTPFIVAINKIDLPEASLDKVKAQLAENNVIVEDYGGKIVAIPVSAKTGEGIDSLLEMILLTAELSELKADPQASFEGDVIESKTDKYCGCVATLVVRNGTLKKGDQIIADGVTAKVKMMRDELGKPVEKAEPGDPVLVLGFSSVPAAGALVTELSLNEGKVVSLEEKTAFVPEKEGENRLKIILKTDVTGSLEAILGCLQDEVLVMEKGVGEVIESDILLAKTLGADIYSFNLPLSSNTKKLAETENVKIKNYSIIYDLLKEIEERILKILEPTIDRKIWGRAEVLAVFEMKGERIAGAKVTEGKINKNFPVCVQRGNKILIETKISSLKVEKQDVNEVNEGNEFGVILGKKVDFQKGDMILSYSLEEN